MFQAESVRDAAWACDWVGTPVPFQRCLAFIIATANKEFKLTAGKFVPVSNVTLLNVSLHIRTHIPSIFVRISYIFMSTTLLKLISSRRPNTISMLVS
jgi:hypothetical protein